MKKILGVLAICLVSLFMLASCNTKVDNSIPNPAITDADPEPEYKVLYDVETAKKKYNHFYGEMSDGQLIQKSCLYVIDFYVTYKQAGNEEGINIGLSNDKAHATKVVEYKAYYKIEYYYGNNGNLNKKEISKEDIIGIIHFDTSMSDAFPAE